MDSSLAAALTNFGALGVFAVLLILGVLVPKPTVDKLERENRRLKEALEVERQRNAELASTAGTTAKLIAALTDIAAERHHPPAVQAGDTGP